MRKLLTIIMLFLNFPGFAQDFIMISDSSQIVVGCTGTFLDEGGAVSGYGNNKKGILTIYSEDAVNSHVKVYFDSFSVHPSDTLFIYDGFDVNAPLIGAFNNNNSLYLHPVVSSITNYSGSLTFYFKSDGFGVAGGWSATVSCTAPCQSVIATLDTLLTSPPVNDSNYMMVCFNDTISFAGLGFYPLNYYSYTQNDTNSVFIWNFGDGETDTGQMVQHHYDTVRGYDVMLSVMDVRGCVSTNSINLRVCISDDPVVGIQPPPPICAGDTLTLKVGYDPLSNVYLAPVSHYQSSSLTYDSATFIPDGGAMGGAVLQHIGEFQCVQPGTGHPEQLRHCLRMPEY